MDSTDKAVKKSKEDTVFYGPNGQETDKEENALAKETESSYYAKEFRTSLYRKGTVIRKMEQERYKWKRVGPICFKNYLNYLKTNSEPRYLMANRNTLD